MAITAIIYATGKRHDSFLILCFSISTLLAGVQLLSSKLAQENHNVGTMTTHLYFRQGAMITPISINLTTPIVSQLDSESSQTANQEGPLVLSANHQRKRTLIIHVGPPKTGSTFLQCSLCADNSYRSNSGENRLSDILLKDSYVFLGTCPWRMCGLQQEPPSHVVMRHRFDAFLRVNLGYTKLIGPQGPSEHKNETQSKRSPIEPLLLQRLADLHRQKRNGILIFEGLANFEPWVIQILADQLKKDWNVRVVIAHRPLFTWLPSKYNSITKVGKNPSSLYWLNHPSCNQSTIKGRLKEDCRLRMEPFDLDNRGKFSDYVHEQLERKQLHPSHAVQMNWARYFDTIIMSLDDLDAHGLGDPLLEHMFCRAIIDAPHTCRHIRGGDYRETSIRNPSDHSVQYDRLVAEAHAQGFYQGNLSRPSLREWAREYQELVLKRKPDDFPMVCLPQSKLDRLEKLSLSLERKLFNSTWTLTKEEAHRQKFIKTTQTSRTFCSVDLNETLKDTKWRSFFKDPYSIREN